MIEIWRQYLYFFGFLSSLAFGGRFILQWISSEMKQESVIPKAFWQFSLVGNLLLLIHSFIQLQLHVALIQTCNAVISFRNLNLLEPKEKQISFKKTISALILALGVTFAIFLGQLYFLEQEGSFFRIPVTPWSGGKNISFFFHFIGLVGLVLFNSRFWVQWWLSEKKRESYVGVSFWWMSLVGDALCLLYFSLLGDMVNFIGPLFGLVPYIRNLMLIYKRPINKEEEHGI